MTQPTFVGYRPGVIADIVGHHALYYAREFGFGAKFEALVATELSAFVLAHDPDADLLLSATDGPTFLGAIVIDHTVAARREGAKLRWFIVSDAARGRGLGRQLMQQAMAFCDARAYSPVTLTTFRGLDAARHLYEDFGFQLTKEDTIDRWHGGVGEQTFTRVASTI